MGVTFWLKDKTPVQPVCSDILLLEIILSKIVIDYKFQKKKNKTIKCLSQTQEREKRLPKSNACYQQVWYQQIDYLPVAVEIQTMGSSSLNRLFENLNQRMLVSKKSRGVIQDHNRPVVNN